MRQCFLGRSLLVAISCLSGCGSDPPHLGTETGEASTDEGGSNGADTTSDPSTSEGSNTAESAESSATSSESEGDESNGQSLELAPDVYYTLQDGASLAVLSEVGVLSNDTAPAGETLVLLEADETSQAGADVVAGADGAFTYSPAPGFFGTDTFEYTASISTGETATATVTVHVAPSTIAVEDLFDGERAFVVAGTDEDQYVGGSVAAIRDREGGDGFDLLVVESTVDGNGAPGRAYYVFAPGGRGRVDADALQAGRGGVFVTPGFDDEGYLAEITHGDRIGDFDGDRVDDVVLHSSPANLLSGRTYFLLGEQSHPVALENIDDAGSGVVVDALQGEPEGAGDVDGDGFDDVFFWCAVVRGTDAPTSFDAEAGVGSHGFTIAPGTNLGSGCRTASYDDIDDDGDAEILVYAQASTRVYVVFGHAEIGSASVDDFVADGLGYYVADEAGGTTIEQIRDVAGGGDVNGDGLGDFVIAGGTRSVVVFGKTTTSPVQMFNIANGFGGFVIEGAGTSVAVGGDLNGDGLAEIVVGDYDGDGDTADSERLFIVYGREETSPIDLATFGDGIEGFVITASGSQLGRTIARPADVDGDGLADLVFGVPYASVDGVGRSGAAIVLPGIPRVGAR